MHQGLLLQLAVATGMVAMTVLIHLGGLAGLLALMRMHTRRFLTRRELFNQAVMLLGAAFGLFALHTVEIWAYAVLYARLRALDSFEAALYFSTTTYTTIGYGDVVLAPQWRVLGAIEGANGIILLGWSTAFFVSVVARMRVLEHDWVLPTRLPSEGQPSKPPRP
ncbi:MAG: ion channel [Caulobacteraceae bacterium]